MGTTGEVDRWSNDQEVADFVLLLIIPLLAVGLVACVRGRVRALAALRFSHVWLLALAFGIQLVLYTVPGPPTLLRSSGYLISYPLGLAFLLLNRGIPGTMVIAFGAAANFLAIAANGGVMPAARAAVLRAGLPLSYDGLYANSTALAHPKLLFLGDIFSAPASFGSLATTFSVGDVVITIGVVLTILRTTLRGTSGGGFLSAGSLRPGA